MQTDRRALLALLSGAILIGFAPIFVRLADVGYTAIAFWRTALSLPILLPWFLAGRRARHQDSAERGAIGWLFLAGFFFAADLGTWHQSIRFTSIANSTLLANLAPLFVTLGAFLLFHQRVAKRFILGLVIAIAGAAVLMSHSLRISRDGAFGDLLGVITAIFYAGYLLGVSRLRQTRSAIEVMWWTSLACSIALLPLVLMLGEPIWPQSLHGWLMLIGLAVLSHVGGQGLIAYAMAHLPASFSAVSLLVQPVAATVFAWLLLGEHFGVTQAIGGAIVLGGIVTCRLAMAKR
ncbi:MAG TPA: DMT family transporter [Nevskiaceae bacterium]|nr:DMT family transporter [Nevskiaceae bacterium]